MVRFLQGNSVETPRNLLESLRVSLSSQTVSWIDKVNIFLNSIKNAVFSLVRKEDLNCCPALWRESFKILKSFVATRILVVWKKKANICTCYVKHLNAFDIS